MRLNDDRKNSVYWFSLFGTVSLYIKIKNYYELFFQYFFLNSNPAAITKFPSLFIGDSESWSNEHLTLLNIPSSCVFIQNLVPNMIQNEN